MKKRGCIRLWKTQIAWSNLNLLEILLKKKRTSIKSECSRKRIILSDYESVVEYILQNKLFNEKQK
jgi:hypothetical protein